MHKTTKKLYLIWAMSMSMTRSGIEEEVLIREPCIYHPIWFRKGVNNIKALLDFDSRVTAMTLAYTSKWGLFICCIDLSAKNIDGSTLITLRMIIACF